jgi:hypothetical protein
MSGKELESEFESRGVRRGGILLLEPPDALELVARAPAAHIRILGIDGFRLGPDWIQPDQDHSVDFTREPNDVPDTWTAAEACLRNRADVDRMFELTLA